MREWGRLAALGFIGYYFSSVVNFHGLRFISVGLERIVLFTYPSIVLVGAALFLKRRLTARKIAAMAVAYGGIVVAFLGEAGGKGSTAETALGVGLVFCSALSYAFFITVGGELIHRVGGFSCVFILAHYGVTHDFAEIASQSTVAFDNSGADTVFAPSNVHFRTGRCWICRRDLRSPSVGRFENLADHCDVVGHRRQQAICR